MLQQAMDSGHTFRSVIAHSICASIQGDAAASLDRMSHTRFTWHSQMLPFSITAPQHLLFNFKPPSFNTSTFLHRPLWLRVTRSSLRWRRHSKTHRTRPGPPPPPPPPHFTHRLLQPTATFPCAAVVHMASHIFPVGIRHQRRCPAVTRLRMDPQLHVAR